MGELTGAVLTIESIREPHSTSSASSNHHGGSVNPADLVQNRSWILANVAYPVQSALSVQRLHQLSAQLLANGRPSDLSTDSREAAGGNGNVGRQPRNNADVQQVRTSGLNEQSFIFWLLLIVILITLIFLAILIAIWCYFCGCRAKTSQR